MVCFPNAKINIGLHIINKREDGFHNLETVFYPIKLSDSLEFICSDTPTSFKNTGIELNCKPQQNLVIKAYYLLKSKYKLPEIAVHLHKIIPTGAGLGGGSADATFMLKALNQHFALKISDIELHDYAAQLGSDCAFLLKIEPFLPKEEASN